MSWYHKSEKAGQANEVFEKIIKTSCDGHCKKFCASDIKGDDSRAVILYSDIPIPIPSDTPINRSWKIQSVKTSTNYEQLYTDACSILNTLNQFQQFYASAVFTNAKECDARIGIIYPSDINA